MKKVIISGALGVMGQIVAETVAADPDYEVVAGIDREDSSALPFPVYENPDQIAQPADVIIDFSHFSAFPKVFDYAEKTATPIVIATTGLTEEDDRTIAQGITEIPVFKSANMSLGINILIRALQAVAPALEEDFDIEIMERHHNRKKDAPSGTALLLADAVNDSLSEKKVYNCAREGRNVPRQENEIGITAVRGGTIPGEHTVLFAGEDELIEFKHTALSRKIFANGALKAAKYLLEQQPGLYDMQDLLNAQA
ncbi:MAG: 4-hydroxy-tetrahydrodipicolinate reductase [Eubacteriaceae bacterium]|jgi:4-hydroxy-tetrahydrodipicolinate reductase